MTRTTVPTTHAEPSSGTAGPPTHVPQFAAAGALLEALAAQDFERLGDSLTATARLRALLPGRAAEWEGRDAITQQITRWFGDTESFDLVDATVGEVGGRVHLRWRLRLQAERLGPGSFVVEQQVYADSDLAQRGRLDRLDLLCTGYRPDHGDG